MLNRGKNVEPWQKKTNVEPTDTPRTRGCQIDESPFRNSAENTTVALSR